MLSFTHPLYGVFLIIFGAVLWRHGMRELALFQALLKNGVQTNARVIRLRYGPWAFTRNSMRWRAYYQYRAVDGRHYEGSRIFERHEQEPKHGDFVNVMYICAMTRPAIAPPTMFMIAIQDITFIWVRFYSCLVLPSSLLT